jgi:hypothetical protein
MTIGCPFGDSNGYPFGGNDSLFGYCTFEGNPPVKILHGSALTSAKFRTVTPKKDNRMKNIVVFEGERAVSAREMHRTYAKLVEDGREQFGKSEDWKIERIREDEDRIIVECAEGADQSWFSEKTCPPPRLSEDGIYQAATRVPPGMWGKAAPTNRSGMPTRARAAAAAKKKKVDVILQVIEVPEKKTQSRRKRYSILVKQTDMIKL